MKELKTKNTLENYLYSTKSSITDQIKSTLGEEDSLLLETTINDGLDWLNEKHYCKERRV